MKKTLGVLVALALLACACAMAEAVVPQFAGLDTADGTYNVCFRRENLKDGALNDVEIYTVDIYDIVDISKLAGGDTFTAEGREVTVESVETNEYGDIDINGGYNAENGFTLTALSVEDGNGWRTTMDDDFPTYTLRDTLSLELAESVTLEDAWDIDADPVKASGIEDVAAAIAASENDRFVPDNTEIRLEGGKVVEIIRRYVP